MWNNHWLIINFCSHKFLDFILKSLSYLHVHLLGISAIIFVMLLTQNVLCLLGVVCIHAMCYSVVVCFEFVLNMPRLSKEQRVRVCLEHTKYQNAEEVRRRGPVLWGNILAPTKRTIIQTYRKSLWEATCHDLNKGRTVRTRENIEHVCEFLLQDGKRSSGRNELGLSRSSFHCIAILDVKFHP